MEAIVKKWGNSMVLSDQIKDFSCKARKAKPKGKVSAEELDEVRAKFQRCWGCKQSRGRTFI